MISRKTTVSAAALLIASASAAAAFPATATTDLNVRSGPGTGYSVVDRLQAGETVEVTARTGSWYQVDGQGWASGNYLDAEGGGTAYIDRSYGYGEYGPVAFYYDDSPYYWDNAGFYFYIRDGRRHRVDRGWWSGHRHNVRWHKNWHNRDWGPNREAHRRGDNDGRRGGGDYQRSSNDGDFRRGGGDGDFRGRMESGRSSYRGEVQSGAGAEVGRNTEIRGGGGLQGQGSFRGNRGGGEGRGGNGGPRRFEQGVPGGGY
jgi:uncharacterized protein YraI